MRHLPQSTSAMVANCVLDTFFELPKKYQPQATQWTVLAGVVLEHPNGTFECVSLGTGVKCLPHEKIHLAKGIVLHDSHAEVLAMRGFNVFLLHQASQLFSEPHVKSNEYLVRNPSNSKAPFALKSSIKIHLFTSTSPCGDASMNKQIASSPDAVPWEVPDSLPGSGQTSPIDVGSPPADGAPAPPKPDVVPILRGRGYYSLLGIIRTKPGRADSPASWSKSCSDKLCSRMALSLVNTPASAVIAPGSVYLSGITVPEVEYCDVGFERAFESRLAMQQEKQQENLLYRAPKDRESYRFQPVYFGRANVTIPFSKEKGKTSAPVSCVYVKGVATEAIVNGVVQGKKAFSGFGASVVAKISIWERAHSLMKNMGRGAKLEGEYEDVKARMAERVEAKLKFRTMLSPWVRNGGNEIVLAV